MEAEHSKRSLLKTITWRITASLDTFVIAWIKEMVVVILIYLQFVQQNKLL